jgi:glycosyltransferase involved in cell wall biosynthesis
MSTPAISVLIPCYNQARYLAQTLESVLSQKNVSLEIIISDDASKDETATIAERFASTDPRVRFKRHEQNLGMATNWNWCLDQARGEFIKYVFGDDYLTSPDSLEQLLAPLLADPSITLSTSARLIVDANTKPVCTTQDFPHTCRLSGKETITRCLLENRNLIGEPSAVLFRRSAARPFDASYRQLIDVELWYHLLSVGDFYYIDRPLCAFRRHELQQTALNQPGRVGEREGIRLHLNYKSLLADYLAAGGSKHLVRQAQFRTLYYAGKAKVPSDEHAANEEELRKRLKPRWYKIYWIHHRLTKPISNLRRTIGVPERDVTI